MTFRGAVGLADEVSNRYLGGPTVRCHLWEHHLIGRKVDVRHMRHPILIQCGVDELLPDALTDDVHGSEHAVNSGIRTRTEETPTSGQHEMNSIDQNDVDVR